MALRFNVSVNYDAVDNDKWAKFETDFISSVWSPKGHLHRTWRLDNEAQAHAVMHGISIHKRFCVGVPASEGHVVHDLYGSLQSGHILDILIEVFRLSDNGPAAGVRIFFEEFNAKVVSVVVLSDELYIVNLALTSGTTQETDAVS